MDVGYGQVMQMFLWIIGVQTTILISIISSLHYSTNRKFDKSEARTNARFDEFNARINTRFDELNGRLGKLDDRVKNIEFGMIEIKTTLRLKECCMISDESQLKKTEM